MEKLKKFGTWLLGLAVLVGGTLLVLLKVKPAPQPAQLPEASKGTETKVNEAEKQAAGAVAAATATAEAKTEALADVAKVDDGAERRKELAALAEKA